MITDGADMFNFEIDEEISEVFWDAPHKQAGADEENDGVAAPSKRGAKKIPEMWTRVFSVYGGDLGNVQAYQTATDLMMAQGFQPMPYGAQEAPWRLLFSPADFAIENEGMTLE